MAPAKDVRGRILVVEDEAYVRGSLVEMLRARSFEVEEAPSVPEAIRVLERLPVDVVLTDLRLPGEDGLSLVRRVAESSGLPVVVLTGHGTIASAVACLKAGASDYILKPADPEALEVALERALSAHALRREVRYLRGEAESMAIGQSAAWRRVLDMVEAAARTDSPVLLLGESGTGKELLARLIHRQSRRVSGPYVRVNCAAVPVEMWESEFFGHRKGAFTGAAADRDGRFLLANRGTLFLDEVGAMPVAGQPKLLRALQDGEFERLGDEKPVRVDVRIVAATNSDLEADVKAGRFRADLFYRLNVLRVPVPSLRDRPEDVPLLAAHFAAEIAGRLGRSEPEVGPAALAQLQAYGWPGNVRELRSVIERAIILNPGGHLDSLDLTPGGSVAPPGASGAERELNLRENLNHLEKDLIQSACRRSGGVRKEAARLLGIDARNLGYYLRKHGLDPDAVAD